MQQITNEIREFTTKRGWTEYDTVNTAKSIVIEAAELLELFQWTHPSKEEIKKNPALLERVREEVADVIIYALEIGISLGFNMENAIREKMKKNAIKYPLPLAENREPSELPS